MSLNNKILWMSVVGLALSSEAWAQDPGSCCLQSTSRLDSLLNPVKGSDEKFFTSGGGPPNVLLILDTSRSMHDWPTDWPSTRGCAHPQIAGLGFDPAGTYRSMISNVSAGTPTFNTNWFDAAKYYEAPQKGYVPLDGAGVSDFSKNPENADTGGALKTWASAAAACNSTSISGIVAGDSSACEACLATQGYYVYDANIRRVWGKFLNFYSPRDSGAVTVLSHLVNDIRNVRFGIEVFGAKSDANCWKSTDRICMFEEMGPKCGASFPLDDSAVSNNRSSIETAMEKKLKWVPVTPIAGALYAAGHYFRNKSSGTDPFPGWFAAYESDNSFDENGPVDQRSVCASCGFNAIILVTDGEPYNDSLITLPSEITSQSVSCVGGSCGSLEPAKVSKWWWEHDMRNDYSGRQKIATYTIGFSQDANSSGTLKTIAQYAGGKFYGATNTVALKDAIYAILEEVNSKNTSFSSAAIASVQSAGSTFAAILPRFSPQAAQPWIGSLRRFNLFNEFVEDINLNPGELQPDGTTDNDKSDIWLVDADMPNGPYGPTPLATPNKDARIVEDADGQFVKWGASGSGTLADGGTPVPANAYWEAGSKLVAKGNAARKIYTVRDSTGDGALTSADLMVSFDVSNSAALGDYLGIKGTSFCPSIVGPTVCNGGPNNGNACASLADCPASMKCTGSINEGLACTTDADCPAGNRCSGGPLDGLSCGPMTDGGTLGACLVGITCSGGTNAGGACTSDANCPGGTCPGVGAVSCNPVAAGTCDAGSVSCSSAGASTNGDMLTKWGLNLISASTELGVTPVPTTQTAVDDLCVRALIQFIRGRDMADEDGNGVRNETRRSVLGDIFHSSPAVVDPPVDKFFCDKGLHNQCARTLYSKRLGRTVETPLDSPAGQTRCDGSSATRDAYDAYQWINRRRDKMVLVGANDGMLHAFHDGNASTAVCTGGLETFDYPAADGTSEPGEEVWAFIPPDLLPRLQEHVFGHAYYVDGDIMVRDIWEDTNADGRKSWNEYHTVAVVADGRGGTHYFALEMRFNNSSVTVGTTAANLTLSDTANNIAAPGFRWMYPQPCSDEASLFGKTLLSLSPKAPPIGPVLIQRSTIKTGAGSPPIPSAGTDRYACSDGTPPPCNTSEQWVVMLGGGWSPSWEKGRGIYMVDVWNGKVNGRNDNLIWKMEYNPSASGEQNDPLSYLRYSVTAPVAMVDYGENGRALLDQDGFFDTASVGDVGGQIWLARFYTPGTIDATTGLVNNWAGGRTFQMDKKGDPNANGDNRDITNVWPFYYITSAAIQPDSNTLRLFTGTGNRYSLLEPLAGNCRFDNPLACAKYDCDENSTEYKIEKNTLKLDKAKMKWQDVVFKGNEADQGISAVAKGICGGASSTIVTASVTQKLKGCEQETGGKSDYGDIRKIEAKCGKDAAGNFSCRRTDNNPTALTDLAFKPKNSNVDALTNNRFFGVWGYGGVDTSRSFAEYKTATGATWTTAKGFDAARISDRTSADANKGDLVDVTTTACDTVTVCTGPQAAPDGKGWFFTYSKPYASSGAREGLEQRTASGSAVLASCVLWNSIFPASTSSSCGLAAVAVGRFHQADFVTGAPNCAAGFKDKVTGKFVRGIDRGIQAPPPEPATAIQISKTGQLRYSALLVEPGSKQATEATVSSGADILQNVYEIPITRAIHNCRHNAGGSVNCVEAPP